MSGGGGIRTHGSGVSGEGETRPDDYKSPALDHSATPPQKRKRDPERRESNPYPRELAVILALAKVSGHSRCSFR